MVISKCYWHLVVRNVNFTLLLTYRGEESQFHNATDIYRSRMAISHCYWHLVVKNANFTLLLKYRGEKWQIHIATHIYRSRMAISPLLHTFIGHKRAIGRSIQVLPADLLPLSQEWHLVFRNSSLHYYWHLVVKNGNFLLLLTSSGQEWPFNIATDIL